MYIRSKRKKEIDEEITQRKEEEKKEKEIKDSKLDFLATHNKKFLTYNGILASMLLEGLRSVYIPIGWKYNVAPTDKGIIVEIRSPKGKYYRSAFKSTALPIYDLNAVEMFVMMVENTIYGQGKAD